MQSVTHVSRSGDVRGPAIHIVSDKWVSKPAAILSDPPEHPVTSVTGNRRMTMDVSGPLSDKSDDTTPETQVTETCLPAVKHPNKMSTFISGVREARTFLAWLRKSCPSGLPDQIKPEKLTVIPSSANIFRAAVSALRSLDEGGV